MAKNLVIVESPAKVKTIKKFLGSNYEITASQGHVRDLPKSSLGIDVDNDYEPRYITIRGKGDVMANLRKLVKKADKVYLATDPDREGEAISWHLAAALKLEGKDINRISFNEITKTAVKNAIKSPRKIDMNLVDAQQARRILDRVVGYEISPVLWAKIKRGLSAGRVQSVALRIICDREDEINAFIPEEYWSVEATLKIKGETKSVTAKYTGDIRNKAQADMIIANAKKNGFKVQSVSKGNRTKNPPLPFTTSTLQQEASKALNFSTDKTMRIAQQLYEGVDIKGMGTVGLITYLRTDSTRISDEADAAARTFIKDTYGEAYYEAPAENKDNGKKIQDAHEAIRPANISLLPTDIKDSLSRDQFKLYQLIWKRFTASRMAPAKYETLSVKISSGDDKYGMSASKLVFDGYMSVYMTDEDEKSEGVMLGGINEKSVLTLEDISGKQHFTKAPAHYTEASLVKTMEELGIGRPSTYAPTISTIIKRHYVTKDQKNLYVTELGEAVNAAMKKSFPAIVDVNFTANMEYLLDSVAEGKTSWKEIIRNTYPDIRQAVETAEKELENVKIADEVTDVICENCGRNMVIKYGPHGRFLACPGFPECRNTKPLLEKTGRKCPKCGGEVIVLKTKKGRRFYGCENQDCDFMSWNIPYPKACPRCGSYMVEKGKKIMCGGEGCGYFEDKPETEEE